MNKLNYKQNRDRLIESKPTALRAGSLKGGGIEQKEKRLMNMDNSMLIAVGEGGRWKRV